MDEIAEKQRQRERELEEKERLRREALLGRATEGISRPSEPAVGITEPENAAQAAAAPASGKYIPRFKRESSGPPSSEPDRWVKPSPPEPDRWAGGSRVVPPQADRWTGGSRAPMQDADRVGSGGSRAPPASSNRPSGAGGSDKPEPWRPSRARNSQRG